MEEFIMDVKETVLSVLNDLTGEDLSDSMDEDIFANGLMDSMASVQMLLNLQEQLGIDVPVSEFMRENWNTPNKIVEQVKKLQNN
ncbi:D-alanine--poly(phosphoribitol) ligase, subunit 2 [Lactobacillus crispatus]|jgi:D-alanine--poly(phosphoribitol) ligase, subunit 2|nr:D-alanine--poly(phosphoribitol) ligase, subunit 2 [Lactobacillus crispatus]